MYLIGTPLDLVGTPTLKSNSTPIDTNMRLQLTDRFCAHAKSTDATQTDYFDATIPGLALRVTAGGTKSWSLLHGIPRKRITSADIQPYRWRRLGR